MAGAASPHNALHRGIRVPDRRAGGFSPLGIPRQSKTRDDYRSPLSSIPRTRHCGRSGICQTPSRHSDADLSSVWLSICRGAPVAGPGEPHEIRGICDTVRIRRFVTELWAEALPLRPWRMQVQTPRELWIPSMMMGAGHEHVRTYTAA